MARSAVVAGNVCLIAAVVPADESMWLPHQPAEISQRLESTGLTLDPARLADLDGAPMAAIVSLGGCPASSVSEHGLVGTNHHCASDTIQHGYTEDRKFTVGRISRNLDVR